MCERQIYIITGCRKNSKTAMKTVKHFSINPITLTGSGKRSPPFYPS